MEFECEKVGGLDKEDDIEKRGKWPWMDHYFCLGRTLETVFGLFTRVGVTVGTGSRTAIASKCQGFQRFKTREERRTGTNQVRVQ